MKKNSIEVRVGEIKKVYNRLIGIYKDSYDIVYDFYKNLYAIDSNIFRYLFKVETGVFGIEIMLEDEYKSIFDLKKTRFDLYSKQNKDVIKAFETLEELNRIKLKIHFSKKDGSIFLFPERLESGKKLIDISGDRSYSECINTNNLKINDKNFILKNPNLTLIKIKNGEDYIKLVNYVNDYDYNHRTDFLFDKDGKLWDELKGQSLEEFDLKNIDFDGKNISGIDISKNPEVHINFDKIVKDLTDSNIAGYNLNKYTFRHFNLTNTDLRNTGATIDLLSCIITPECKMSSGTLFDEDNKFLLGDKTLTLDDVENVGIKIYKKEMR